MYATEVHVHVVRINNCTIMYKLNEPYPPPHSNNWTVPSTSLAAREIQRLQYFLSFILK